MQKIILIFKIIIQIHLMGKVSIYNNLLIKNNTLVKTNVDFNSSQENGAYKLKERNKNIFFKNKKEDNSKIVNPNKNIEENNEKYKENENIVNNNNVDDEKKNEYIMIEKINNDNKEHVHKDININENIKNSIEEEKKEEDPLISYINSNRKISEEEIKNSSKLILEEIDGNLLNGKKIEINAGGMVDGRNKYDGFTIFGQKNIDGGNDMTSNLNSKISDLKPNIDNNNIFTPDYELNYSKFLGYPYIFAIYYKKEEKSYYIRAYAGKGSDNKILFIKLTNENKLVLKQKELISAGSIIFQVTPLDNNCLEIINLSDKRKINNKKIFDGINQKIVTIGRHKECDFFFVKDKSFSRYQTSFEFDENTKKWSIIDGKDNKGSTNGTWIFGTHSFLIKKEMIVEILNSKIKIKETKNENFKEE